MSTTTTTTTTTTTPKPGTTGSFKYIDPTSYGASNPSSASQKPWSKVDGGGVSYELTSTPRPVTNIRASLRSYTTDNAGFSIQKAATRLSAADFFASDSDSTVRGAYYDEVEAHLKSTLPNISKVVIFDHTIRRRAPNAPRQPVQQVHVDQTPAAAEVRVRRHLPAEEADAVLSSGRRWQIVNVWRPIARPATDFPLAVVDWRSTRREDFVPVDLLYPDRSSGVAMNDGEEKGKKGVHSHGEDDRGLEAPPLHTNRFDRTGYVAKGETYAVAPNPDHRFFYVKDMQPDETMFIKCFDSRGQDLPGGRPGIAMCTPHTAFVDPDTPEGEEGRQSIEVRCLVFYDD